MRLAAKMAGDQNFTVLAAVRDRLAAADQAGWADEDFSALMKLLK